MIDIRTADDTDALEIARRLIRAHFAAHSSAHDPESSESIVSALPQPYVPPRGGLWVAFVDGVGCGCAALREIDNEVGEVKRMYVDPEMRGKGVARTLALHVIAKARAIGYETLRLGTLRSMRPAQSLYQSLGFRSIPPYRPIEFGDTVFYELDLRDGSI
ncbi:MAG: GNAT family N-acetyltransferase [Gemmatimonadales bacterium]